VALLPEKIGVYYEGKMTVQGAEVNVTLTVLNGRVRQNIIYRMTGYQSLLPPKLEFYALRGRAGNVSR
jgi:hypothetical protein